MNTYAPLSNLELQLFQKFIRDKCGISLDDDKAYLIESRLARLLVESKLSSFGELYNLLYRSNDPVLVQKLINAIATNETLWFRDQTPWDILEKIYLPKYVEMLREGTREKIRIWSAAASTGQEAYSTAMCIDGYLKKNAIRDVSPKQFEIVGTDISDLVLKIATNGVYDAIAIKRGLDNAVRDRYFKQNGNVWALSDEIKNAVRFSQFNLQNSFISLGKFDVIFCRYVLIYFSEDFKRSLAERIFNILNSDGLIFLGSYENCGYIDESFVSNLHENGVYYTKRKGRE